MLVAGPAVFLVIGFAGFALAGAFLAYPRGFAKPLIILIEVTLTLSIGATLGLLMAGPPERIPLMTNATLFGLCSRSTCGAWIVRRSSYTPSRCARSLPSMCSEAACSCIFGVIARRGAAAGIGGDPVPQAMVITGIVVAFSATALAVALLLRLFEVTGQRQL